jgi:hypothetical protein
VFTSQVLILTTALSFVTRRLAPSYLLHGAPRGVRSMGPIFSSGPEHLTRGNPREAAAAKKRHYVRRNLMQVMASIIVQTVQFLP